MTIGCNASAAPPVYATALSDIPKRASVPLDAAGVCVKKGTEMAEQDRGNQGGGSSDRGFAAMDEDERREIASEGGSASCGNLKNDPERAAEAGRKGGEARSQGGSQQGSNQGGGNQGGGSQDGGGNQGGGNQGGGQGGR